MSNISVKRVQKDQFEQTVEDKTVEGWNLKSSNGNVAIMEQKGSWGSAFWHVVLFLFFGWYTLFIPNVLYAYMTHSKTSSELHIKVEDSL